MTQTAHKTTDGRPTTLGGWEVTLLNGVTHVSPLYDCKPHEPHEGCWCRPQWGEGGLFHNAMDRRERHETGEVGLH